MSITTELVHRWKRSGRPSEMEITAEEAIAFADDWCDRNPFRGNMIPPRREQYKEQMRQAALRGDARVCGAVLRVV